MSWHAPWCDGLSLVREPLQKNKNKVIELRSLIRPDLVPIVEVELGTRRLSFGEEFEATGEWLKTARFKIRNDSEKEIVHISFELELPETSSSGNVMVFPIDDTAWSGGEFMRQDPRNPMVYVPIVKNTAN